MAKKNVSPLMTWAFWGIAVLGIFLLVTWEYFVAGFSADSSKITYLIVFFFIYGFFASLRLALYLQNEFKTLKAIEADQSPPPGKTSEIGSLFETAEACIRRGERIEVKNLVSAYAIRIKARVDNIAVISAMLITIGLLGTVVGLIITVTGLGHVLSSSGSDFSTIKEGLNETISGMGTAFYTTFFGALLGGVVLKVLGSEMKKSTTQLVADALRYSELAIAPQYAEHASEALAQLEGRVATLGGQLEQLGHSFTSVIDVLDSKQHDLASGLSDLVSIVEEINQRAGDRMEALVGAIEHTIEETNAKADERLGSLMDGVGRLVDEVHGKADERLAALLKSVEQAADSTHRQANERLVELVDSVGLSIDQSRRQAEEKLNAKASELARKLTEAAGVLSALASSSETPPTNPPEK